MTDSTTTNIVPVRPLDEASALAWLCSQPGGSTTLPAAALARRWGWPEHRARRRLSAWHKTGLVRRRGRVVMAVPDAVGRTVHPTADPTVDQVTLEAVGKSNHRVAIAWKNSPSVRRAAQAAGQAFELIEFPARHPVETSEQPVMSDMPDTAPDESPPPARPARRAYCVADALAYTVAVGLAACAAWFSLKGLVVLFPGTPVAIVIMGVTMEAAKLVAAGWLAGAWRQVPWIFRGVLMLLIVGLAIINAAGTFSQLTSAHVGNRAITSATRTMEGVDLDTRIEVASAKLVDLDRRIAAIDGIISGAAQRGRANTATAIMTDQRQARAALVGERQRAAEALQALKIDRSGIQARATIAESEAIPIMYAAEVLGIGADPERAIRWLIALLVLCLDPMALALTASVSVRRAH